MAKIKRNKCSHEEWKPNHFVTDPLTGEVYVLLVCCDCYERNRWVLASVLADPLNEHFSDEQNN